MKERLKIAITALNCFAEEFLPAYAHVHTKRANFLNF